MVNSMGYFDNLKADELEHHGILGQKWGVRRFEKAGGGLTAAGRARYQTDSNGNYKKIGKSGESGGSKVTNKIDNKIESTEAGKKYSKAYDKWSKEQDENDKAWNNLKANRKKMSKEEYSKKYDEWSSKQDKLDDDWKNVESLHKAMKQSGKEKANSDTVKKVAIAGAVVAGAALATYGGYKLYQLNKKATNGIRNYEKGKADDAFKAAGKMRDAYAINMKVAADHLNNGNKSSSDIMRKSAEDFWDKSKEFYQIGSEHTGKAVQKKYSVKDKVDYLKGNYGKIKPGSTEWLQKQGIKTIQPDRIDWQKPTIAKSNLSAMSKNNSNERLQSVLNQMKDMNTSATKANSNTESKIKNTVSKSIIGTENLEKLKGYTKENKEFAERLKRQLRR